MTGDEGWKPEIITPQATAATGMKKPSRSGSHVPQYLGEESFHILHCSVQLLLCVSGSLQGVFSCCHGAVTVQAPAVSIPLIVTATCTPTRAFPTGGIAGDTANLLGRGHMSLYSYGKHQLCV